MGRVNGKFLNKPMRWGMILTAFGRQNSGVIFEPEEERLARLKDIIPPRPKEEQLQPPKAKKV